MLRDAWHRGGMEITDRHREVERRLRRLVADAEMFEPDRVEYEPEAVVFFWDGPKLAIAVDFDRPEGDIHDPDRVCARDLWPDAPLESLDGARPGLPDKPGQGRFPGARRLSPTERDSAGRRGRGPRSPGGGC
jgi:hypothetical protein